MRAKWSAPIRKYWKISEQMMVKYCDLAIESLIVFYQDHHQTTFRVMEASEVRRLQRIPCRQVLQEIFDGKFIELKNGMLRYKQ